MNDQYTTYIEYFRTDNQNNGALTQVIPMDVFNSDEKNIRKFVKEIGGRVYFRGPRRATRNGNPATNTRRCDAKGVVIYA